MFIRVRMLGSGTVADPFRAPIPSYQRMFRDDETPLGIGAPRWCLIDISPDDFPAPIEGEAAPLTVNVPGIGLVVRQIAPAHRARILAFIRDKYREHANDYDVDVR